MAVKEKREIIITIASKLSPGDHIVVDGAFYEVHEIHAKSTHTSAPEMTFFGHRVGAPRHKIKLTMHPGQEIVLSRVMPDDPVGSVDVEKQDASDVWEGMLLPRAREKLLYSGIPARVLWSRQSKCWNDVDNEIQLLIEFNEGEPAELIDIKGIAHNLQTFDSQIKAHKELLDALDHYRHRIADSKYLDQIVDVTQKAIAQLANMNEKD